MATAAAGLKYNNRTDVLLMVFDKPASVAGVFTKSKCPSAPVDFCRANLGGGAARAVVVNSGNANAFTGLKGKAATELTAKSAAAAIGCSEREVFLASTGVIGEPLDASKFAGVLGDMNVRAEADFWQEAAKAIMTTDTYPKVASRTAEIGGVIVTINGIAKGAGMIAPDMATMLSFVVTDADIEPAALQALLSAGVGPTFNSVTVDSDTSTSDTLMLFATGAAAEDGQVKVTNADDERLSGFRAALNDLLKDLALQVVRDGEGARTRGQLRQRQRLHRQGRDSLGRPLRQGAGRGAEVQAGRGVPRLDRRDRRASERQGVRRRHGRSCRIGQARRLA
jgi:glutamate N-acetyltransferase/amino-acid N-acetyltransferase